MSGGQWNAGATPLASTERRCLKCGSLLPHGLGPRVDDTRDWIAAGLVLERHVAADAPTAAAVRDLMSAVVQRSLMTQALAASVLIRRAGEKASSATLLDLAHWALGPGLWTGPGGRVEVQPLQCVENPHED